MCIVDHCGIVSDLYHSPNIFQRLLNTTNIACSIIDNCDHMPVSQGCIPLLPVCTASKSPSQLMEGGIRSPSSKLIVSRTQHINPTRIISVHSAASPPP